jgi:glycosyltransferase involved in cell wall biosynthesis
VKVDRAELPSEPNIHWLGQRTYDVLPSYMKGFDVCLMPFALNSATEFINPTKTLEYMAAGKPIVSTPIADVVRLFASLVSIASTPPEFLASARAAAEGADPALIELAIERARRSSWDSVVREMTQRIDAAIARNTHASRTSRVAGAPSATLREAAVRRSP